MSTADVQKLDPCGCCEGPAAEPAIHNAPGLPALQYRVGTHSRFLERMRHGIPLVVGETGSQRPLARLTARTTDDPSIALLDACAMVADILTFYQERLANEGFLRTATERRSVLELARAIGYELSPGVAAAVHLTFVAEQAPGAPSETVVPQSTQVQSVPPADKLPQIFETSADALVRPEWNAMRPRLTRPAEMALIAPTSTGPLALHLLGAPGTFSPDMAGLLTGVLPGAMFRLDPAADAPSTAMDAIPVSRVYVTEGGVGVAKGDMLLFAGSRLNEFETLALRVADVAEEVQRRASGDEIRRVRVDLEPLPPSTGTSPLPVGAKTFGYKAGPLPAKGVIRLQPEALTSSTLTTTILGHAWREADLHALLGIQNWARLSLMRAVNRRQPAEPMTPEAGAFAFRETLGFFGQNAPRWASLPSEKTKGDPYLKPWDEDDLGVGSPDDPVSIWKTSQGDWNTNVGADVFLDRAVKGVTTRTWALFEAPSLVSAFLVHDAREVSRADFGVSGRALALGLRTPDGAELGSTDKPEAFRFRTTTARVASRRLQFAELPIDTPLDKPTEIELDRFIVGLSAGQPIAVSGERHDLRGETVAEVATLADIVHSGGRTTLILDSALQYQYVRDTVTISANVVPATHGETVTEVLGSGDASTPNQRFSLKKPPLTYVSAPASGSRSTLEVRVNRVRWEATPSLYLAGPEEQAYTVRIDDDARAEVIFGDGEHGARVPSGAANVTATYRSGIGADGEVDAGTLTVLRTIPLGIRSVANPVAASGAESPERLENARQNAPVTVVTFERVVSLTDFEDFARTFPGIGKALADRLQVDGRDVVHVTVAGATGGAPGGDVLDHLRDAIAGAGDTANDFQVNAFSLRYFTVDARVAIDPRRIPAEVLDAVAERLRDAFSFERRSFGQSVTPSEVVARIHEVAGVLGTDLESLAEYIEGEAPAPSPVPVEPIVSRRARWDPDARVFVPADLLLVNPVGITLAEME